MSFPEPSAPQSRPFPLFAATDPVGGLDHSIPIHPDQGSNKPAEYWEDQIDQRRPRKRRPQPKPTQGRNPGDEHRIDDYA